MIIQRLGTVAVLLVITITCMFTTCYRDDLQPPPIKYWFKEGVQLSPYRLDYKIGDTLWLTLDVPGKLLYDTISGKTILFDSASFTAAASVKLLYHNPFIKDGPFASFTGATIDSGNIVNADGTTYASVSFGCSPSSGYSLRLGIILLKPGAFEVSLLNQRIAQCVTGMDLYTARISYFLDVPDSHLSFYQQLSFGSVGQAPDQSVILDLQSKEGVAINVEE